MLDTFAALLAAHLLADFVFQFDWIAKAKQSGKKIQSALCIHASIVGLTTFFAIGATTLSTAFLVAVVIISHVIIDIGKIYLDRWPRLQQFQRAKLWTFWIDQIIHLVVLAALATKFDTALDEGFWWQLAPNTQTLILVYVHLAGFITATRVGQFSISMFMAPFQKEDNENATNDGKQKRPPGGAWIGLIERSIIYGLIFLGQTAAIGIVIALKSLLRFKETDIASEYLIIGSLISLTWVYVVAHATKFVIENWWMTAI